MLLLEGNHSIPNSGKVINGEVVATFYRHHWRGYKGLQGAMSSIVNSW
jgi:hypothetical protein